MSIAHKSSFVILFVVITTWNTSFAQDEQNLLSQLLSSVTIQFDPPIEIYGKEDEEFSVSFNIQSNLSLEFDNDTWTTYTGTLLIKAEPSFRLELLQDNFKVSFDDFNNGFNRTLKMKGLVLGHAKLKFYWIDVRNEQLLTTLTTEKTSTVVVTTTDPTKLPTIPQTDATTTTVLEPLSSDTNEPSKETNSTLNKNADNYEMDTLTEIAYTFEEMESNGDENATIQPQPTSTNKSKRKPKKHKEQRRSAEITTVDSDMLIDKEHSYLDFLRRLKRDIKDERDTMIDSSNPVSSSEKMAKKILLSDTYKVHVLRKRSMLDTIFIIVVGTFVLLNVTMMGCAIELPIVWKVLKKPIGPAVGFVSQYAFMPLVSYGLGQVFLEESILQLGLFTLGCSPGGNGSNFWTLLFNGDINLSVTMTFISTLSAMFMMPLWLYTLGQTILSRGNIQIPFLSLVTSLVTFCIPISIGVVIRHYRPSWAEIAKKIVRPLTIILLIALNVFALLTSTYVFKLMTWRMLVSGMCMAWGGYAFGALLAWICRLNRPQIIAVSIETAIQNAGIAFMVLSVTLKEPDSDLSSIVPVAQITATGIPLLLFYFIYKTVQKLKLCLRKKKDHQVEEREKDIDVVEPLVINRDSIPPPSYTKRNTDVDKSHAPNNEQEKLNNVSKENDIDTTTPIYANMYQNLDDAYYEKVYQKPQVQLKLSTGESKYDVPRFQMRTFEEEVESCDSEENTRQSDDEESNV